MSVQAIAVRAHCNDCEWRYERALDAGDLDADENQEIAMRVTRTHAFKCGSEGRDNAWGETSDVELDMTEAHA